MDENSVLDPSGSINRNAYKNGTGTTINCLVICGYLNLPYCPKAKNSHSQLTLSMANLNRKTSHFSQTFTEIRLIINLSSIFYTCSFIIWLDFDEERQSRNKSIRELPIHFRFTKKIIAVCRFE